MNTADREERLYRGCLALEGLRDMLQLASPGTTVPSENLGALIELIEQDIRLAAGNPLPAAFND